jgi:hypothetical protein
MRLLERLLPGLGPQRPSVVPVGASSAHPGAAG